MKICIFFDGQNFYRSLQRFDENLRVDYDRLAAWITQTVGGANAMFGGAYYYVGVSADAPQVVEGFLKGLELRNGYYVKREARVRRAVRCPQCGEDNEFTTEKRVDTRLVADLIQHAAKNNFDAAVLVSGDADFVPAVEAVNALGKQVWVATWSADELSNDLRVQCFGHVKLADGLPSFRIDRLPRDRDRDRGAPSFRAEGRGPRPVSRLLPGGPSRVAAVSGATAVERALGELQRAEARLPHVSRGYFVMRWKSHLLPPAGHEREQLVQQMVEAGLIEEVELTDGDGRVVIALRSRERDGNVALPGQQAPA